MQAPLSGFTGPGSILSVNTHVQAGDKTKWSWIKIAPWAGNGPWEATWKGESVKACFSLNCLLKKWEPKVEFVTFRLLSVFHGTLPSFQRRFLPCMFPVFQMSQCETSIFSVSQPEPLRPIERRDRPCTTLCMSGPGKKRFLHLTQHTMGDQYQFPHSGTIKKKWLWKFIKWLLKGKCFYH